MYKLIIDLEMCGGIQPKYKKSLKVEKFIEIIEIGAVLIGDENEEIKRFHTYVKPRYSILTNKITELTGITSADLLFANDISVALNNMVGFIEEVTSIENTTMCGWSDTDKLVLQEELAVKGIDNNKVQDLCNRYFDIQKEFDSKVNLQKQSNLRKALEMVGLDFEGREHGALTDAINTYRIYEILEKGDEVNSIIKRIQDLMTPTELTSSLGAMFDFSKLNFS